MRSVHLMAAALVGAAGLIFPPASGVSAESIYHWKDRDGVSCYSNTNVPAGAAQLSVMRAAGPDVREAEASGAGPADSEGAGEAKAVESPGEASGSKTAMLQARIDHRRESIGHIENLLKTYPDDAGLRRHLALKKQYLHEDLVQLKLVED